MHLVTLLAATFIALLGISALAEKAKHKYGQTACDAVMLAGIITTLIAFLEAYKWLTLLLLMR